MSASETTPPGWYVDPTGRHEHRFWDGTTWTASVSDADVTSTDEPGALGEAAPAGVYGYRAIAVAAWRVAALYAATLTALAAFVFEVIASLQVRASASDLGRWAWLYRKGRRVVLYGYPPLGLWFGLVLTAVLASALLMPRSQALKKTGLSVRWRWSARAERERLGAGLSAMGRSRTLLRGRGAPVLVALTVLAALLVVALSGYALVTHHGVLDETGTTTGTGSENLTAGLGPWVCAVTGVVSAILVLVAWPWRKRQHVLVLRDGTVRAQEHN